MNEWWLCSCVQWERLEQFHLRSRRPVPIDQTHNACTVANDVGQHQARRQRSRLLLGAVTSAGGTQAAMTVAVQ